MRELEYTPLNLRAGSMHYYRNGLSTVPQPTEERKSVKFPIDLSATVSVGEPVERRQRYAHAVLQERLNQLPVEER